MDYKIIIILIAVYLLITYALYNCPDNFAVLNDNNEIIVKNDTNYYKTNPKELLLNKNYTFPPLEQININNPNYIDFIDISNSNPKALDNYKKLQFTLKN